MSDRPSFWRVEKLLAGMVSAGVASAAAGLVATAGEILWEGTTGEAREGVSADAATRFDYASLTKPFVATLALTLDVGGVLPLATRIGDVWPQAHRALASRPLSDLLRHRSGLAAWTPLYYRCDGCRSVEEALEMILAGGENCDLLGARAGTYSDLGYILWSRAAESTTGTPLAELLESRILGPLGLVTIEPSPGERPDLAESRMGTGQEVKLAAKQGFVIQNLGPPPVGTPQDGNGRFLTGLGASVCGHVGLFGGARDLWRLGVEWLTPGRLLTPEGVAAALAGGGPYALGWWRRTLRGSAGPALPPTAFGHTGFAGNSFWIDPEERRIFVMLTSRCDPAANMNHWRRRFNSAAARSILEREGVR